MSDLEGLREKAIETVGQFSSMRDVAEAVVEIYEAELRKQAEALRVLDRLLAFIGPGNHYYCEPNEGCPVADARAFRKPTHGETHR